MQSNNQVISYHRMRFLVGILGISLPFSLLIGMAIINHFDILHNKNLIILCKTDFDKIDGTKDMISDYYYSPVGEIFVGTLSAVAFFMFSYKGYKNKEGEFMPSDNFMVKLAGICALGIVIFPTYEPLCMQDNLRSFVSGRWIGNLHYFFATLFFISLGIVSLVNFRRNKTAATFGMKKYDWIYKTCGIGIFCSIAVVGLYYNTSFEGKKYLEKFAIGYIFESFALIFFGVSWLVKGSLDKV
jgi:hypothetical protein